MFNNIKKHNKPSNIFVSNIDLSLLSTSRYNILPFSHNRVIQFKRGMQKGCICFYIQLEPFQFLRSNCHALIRLKLDILGSL